ncbi:NAD(P)/FAD-dependent oxidoreductase [Desulfogranum marinum]|uniref:NAD(P)/FAD-dependent oxidoreductase n=1 Tax=Desulfogranum marinum TaxID=453220 RepID=UPI0029C70079|nr:NAD(P)/FAD-dependent oxidoreductase [Desulfogranum marinum]
MTTLDTEVIIVGGGLAGLACAKNLHAQGIKFLLLEAENRVGGRIKTDKQNGYLLDRGFQVLQTAYPEASRAFDYSGLDLQPFAPGVKIRIGRQFHTVADPLRKPQKMLQTLRAPIGTLGDRLRLVRLAGQVRSVPLEALFQEKETTTIDFLREQGFSETMINRFFVPFFGGACLDRQIRASSRVFKYILRMFAAGDAALPKKGMEQLPSQLAQGLPAETIQASTRVSRIDKGLVTLENNTSLSARAVVVATEGPETQRLLGLSPQGGSVGETCFYFSSDKEAWHTPFLMLNGTGKGPINNIAIPSMVSSEYAPPGKSLISVVALDNLGNEPEHLLSAVNTQLVEWYGDTAKQWEHLATYTINYALPEQLPPTVDPTRTDPRHTDGIFVCGEHSSLPAIQWALYSGRQAAESIGHYLQEERKSTD